MDAFVFQIAVIFIPGIIWARIDAQFGQRTRPSQTEMIILVLIYGLVAYSVTYLVYDLLGYDFSTIPPGAGQEGSVFVAEFYDEILVTLVVVVILSVVWLYVTNKKLAARILQSIGATKTYGDEDVWDFTFNSTKPSSEYIHFKDIKNELIYGGWVNTYSESNQIRELLLRDAKVYQMSTGQELYEVPYLYVCRKPEDVLVDFPVDDEGNMRA